METNLKQALPPTTIIHSESEMLDFGRFLAKQLLATSNLSRVIELVGDVGIGKTTFTRGFATGLGITEPVTSPSFTISKSYAFNADKAPHILKHYDFYRLSDPGLMSEDLEDSIQNGDLIVLEWADSVKDFLPPGSLRLEITYNSSGNRIINIHSY